MRIAPKPPEEGLNSYILNEFYNKVMLPPGYIIVKEVKALFPSSSTAVMIWFPGPALISI
jgi:hypothetical protein